MILTYKPLEVRRNVAIRSYICARKNDLIWKKNTWEGNFISEIWVFLAEKCRTEQWFTTNVLMNFLNFLLNSSLTLFLIYLFVVLKFLVKFLPLEIVVKVRSMKFLLLNNYLSLPFWFLCTISSCQLASIKVSTIKVHFLYVIAAAWYSVTYFLLKVPKKPFVFVNPYNVSKHFLNETIDSIATFCDKAGNTTLASIGQYESFSHKGNIVSQNFSSSILPKLLQGWTFPCNEPLRQFNVNWAYFWHWRHC